MGDFFNLKTGVSKSKLEQEAVDELYAAIYQEDIQFAVFFCSVDYDLPKLGRALKNKFNKTCLIGCTTAGELTPEGMMDGGLTGFSISSNQFIAASAIFDMKDIELDESVVKLKALQAQVTAQTDNAFRPLSWLLCNSVNAKVERVLDIVGQTFGSTPVIGGSPGGGDTFSETFVYYEGAFHGNHTLVSYISTTLPFETFKIDDFNEESRRVVLTEVDAASRIVSEIDGLPAKEGYLAAVGSDDEDLTPAFFAAHPLAAKVAGNLYVRAIAPPYAHKEVIPYGSLQFFCAVERGMVLSTVSTKESVANFEDVLSGLNARLGAASLVMACDCIYRKFDYKRHDIADEISKVMVRNNVIGFHGYGEQIGVMHVNQTFSGVYFGVMS